MKQSRAFLFSLGLAQASLGAYIWPAKTDDLEDIIFNDSGFGEAGIGNHILQCGDEGRGGPGAQVAAAWLRTTYHDMATYRVAEGAGGVDASILFETDRMENIGIGFNNTFLDLLPGYSSRVSFADMLAAAAYFALRKCGGPALRVRAGRIDATEAGPFGVPDPTETFNVHMHKFARAGRDPSQMIMMIACGHSIGGVHGNDFPTITGNSDPAFTSHFDSTFTMYDNHISLDFISSNTSNPLASGPLMSRSDFRIFSSDMNATITRMSTPQGFRDTCQDTLSKMIDTVPSNVQLTEVIQPSEVRPFQLQLTLGPDGTVAFAGQIRVHTTDMQNGDKLDVKLLYTDRNGRSSATNVVQTTYAGRGASTGLDFQFDYYDINAALPNGISKFNIQINGKTYDNGGNGFPIQDNVVIQFPDSCFDPTTKQLTVYGVVSDRLKKPVVELEVVDKRPRIGSIVPALVKDSVKMARLGGAVLHPQGYGMYKGTYTYTTSDGGEFSLAAYTRDKSGKRIRIGDDYKKTTVFNGTTCATFDF